MSEEPPKSPEAKAFLAHVMRMASVTNPTELAAKMGKQWTTPSQLRRIYKWAAGGQAPNNAGTMALLSVAGLLSESPRAAGAGPSDDSSRLLGELEEAVGAMVESQTKLVNDLIDTRVRLQRLEAARPSASARKSRKMGTG